MRLAHVSEKSKTKKKQKIKRKYTRHTRNEIIMITIQINGVTAVIFYAAANAQTKQRHN